MTTKQWVSNVFMARLDLRETLSFYLRAQGDLVRSGYPGYTGIRPKLQILHGMEQNKWTLIPKIHPDYLMSVGQGSIPQLYQLLEAIKEWTNVFRIQIQHHPHLRH